MITGDHKLLEIQNAITRAEEEGDYSSLGDLHSQFEDHDGFSAKSRAEQLMVGLGFTESDFDKALKDFSGAREIF